MSRLDELDLLDDALLADLRVLASDEMRGRSPDSAGSARARAHVVSTLYELGVAPVGAGYERPFSWDEDGRLRHGTNVVAIVPGTARPARVVVLGAHYDHLGQQGVGVQAPHERIYNGADDNASGVAALLGLARHFSRHRPASTLVFAFFDGEEAGMKGSTAFVENPPLPLDQIALLVNLDMLGRDVRGTLWAVGPHKHPALRPPIEAVAARARVTLRVGHDRFGWVPFLDWDWTTQSDQAAFHERGIPFVHFGVANHEDTHATSDTADEIDEDFYVRAFHTVLDAVTTLDATAGDLLAARAADDA